MVLVMCVAVWEYVKTIGMFLPGIFDTLVCSREVPGTVIHSMSDVLYSLSACTLLVRNYECL